MGPTYQIKIANSGKTMRRSVSLSKVCKISSKSPIECHWSQGATPRDGEIIAQNVCVPPPFTDRPTQYLRSGFYLTDQREIWREVWPGCQSGLLKFWGRYPQGQRHYSSNVSTRGHVWRDFLLALLKDLLLFSCCQCCWVEIIVMEIFLK